MNLLKEISVTGMVTPIFAKLTLQFTFHNPTEHTLSPRYFFPIPENASITGMQLFTAQKTLLRSNIAPLTDMGSVDDGYRLSQISPQLYALQWEALPPGETCTILIDCLLHLLPREDHCRLVLPFGLPCNNDQESQPCPVHLDLSLKDTQPLRLNPEDSFCPDTQALSRTTWTGKDFVLDLKVQARKYFSLIQEEFGKGLGFARIPCPNGKLLYETPKKKVLLLLDLSHATKLQEGNALKELCFRIASSLPPEIPTEILSVSSPKEKLTPDQLYEFLQILPSGVGNPDELFQSAREKQTSETLTLLVSSGSYLPENLPDFPVVLFTVGNSRETTLSHHLKGVHFHYYPNDNPEKDLSSLMDQLLHPLLPMEIFAEGSTVHDCFLFPYPGIPSKDYLDVAFSYTGQPPRGFSLWQGGKKQWTIPLQNPKLHPRHPDAEQLFAIAKINALTELSTKASPVSYQSIRRELAELQTKYRILGSETILVIPDENQKLSGIPTRFYSAAQDTRSAFSDRHTIFGEGVRKLSKEEHLRLTELCRKTIYQAIRDDASIRSPLGITPKIAAEETTLSVLALLADGNTDPNILQNTLFYLKAAPETPWSDLLSNGIPERELLQRKLLPFLPDFETLLQAAKDPIPLSIAANLLLWLTLV